MKKILLSLVLSLSCFADTGWLFQPLYSQGSNNPTQTVTAGHVGTLYFNNASQTPGQAFLKMDDYPSTNWVPIASTVSNYFVTCTANAATATTPVHCLPSSNLIAGQKAYLEGFHAQVNGGTTWVSGPSCQIQDTTGTAFVSITSLTANTYFSGSSTNTTRSAPYYLGSGGAATAGLDLVCTANGAGSPLVFTLFGVVK